MQMSDTSPTKLRVLALTGHPIDAAGSRYRVLQFLPGLRHLGFQVDHQSFFTSAEFAKLYTPGERTAKLRALAAGTLRRTLRLATARRYDVVLIHIWLHPITFPPFDLALRALRVPVVYDIDDAFYTSFESPLDRFRDVGWTVRLMQVAHTVIAGSDRIRDFVRSHNQAVEVLPTAIDTDRFVPRDLDHERNPLPVIGWVGSHSTAPYLEPLYPVIQRLAREHEFVFRVVGASRKVALPSVHTEWVTWQLEQEVAHFRDLDIGLYPLQDNELSRGKHGFKLHQYMATGVPTVASAVGLNPSIIRHGENAFLASNPDEWYATLSSLLRDEALRRRVGGAGRQFVQAHSSLRVCGERLAVILQRAAESGRAGSRFNRS
jgi:glycosyltransferase involved in cell wall biosynthesis